MVSPVGLNQYPNADPSGQSLPFSIGDPYGLAILSIGVAAGAAFTFPSDTVLVDFFATARCLVGCGITPALTEDLFVEGLIIVPKGGSHGVLLPDLTIKCISADGATTGKLYCQAYRPWKSAGVSALQQRM